MKKCRVSKKKHFVPYRHKISHNVQTLHRTHTTYREAYRKILAVSSAPLEAGLSIPSIAKKIVMAIIEKIWDKK